MKTWIGIAAFIGLSLVLGLGSIMFRQSATVGEAPALVSGAEAERGLAVVSAQGCIACHSLDGKRGIGPSFHGIYGRSETMTDGSTVVVDADYLRESITDPAARVVAGYDNLMLRYAFSAEDMDAIIEFLRQVGQPQTDRTAPVGP